LNGSIDGSGFIKPGRIVLDEKPIPDIDPLDALLRITTTTIEASLRERAAAPNRW
jgi:hypothetical protein